MVVLELELGRTLVSRWERRSVRIVELVRDSTVERGKDSVEVEVGTTWSLREAPRRRRANGFQSMYLPPLWAPSS